MNSMLSELIEVAEMIYKNIDTYGLERYDLRDTRGIPFLLKGNFLNSMIRKVVLLAEEIAPIFMRKALSAQKKRWPTMYTFLGNACFLAEKINIDIYPKFKSKDFADLLLSEYVKTSDVDEWWQVKPHVGIYKATINVGEKKPTLSMHALTRCNSFLLNIGKYYNNTRYINIGVESASFILNHYRTIDFEEGKKSISYYYNTCDSTININSEFAHWLSLIPTGRHTTSTEEMFYGILRLLLDEQNCDGSWFYFSKWHMKKYAEKASCDCHHTGTVLYNIANIVKCEYLDSYIKERLVLALNKGMDYYVNNFFDLNSGKGITQMGYKRTAGPVQYSEAIFAFCDFLTLKDYVDSNVWTSVKSLLPKVMKQNIHLINKKDGSAPSEKILRWKNINSIRWGNGPILQAIMSYLSIYDEIYNSGSTNKEVR